MIFFLIISFIFPESGSVNIAGIDLKFLPVEKVINPPRLVTKEKEVDSLLAKIDTSAVIATDTLETRSKSDDSLEIIRKVNERIGLAVVQKMEFGDEGASVLYPFFEKLKNRKSVRILHYGDSQIESDRMTGFLRQKLQSQFGGTGVGLIIPSDFYNSQSYIIRLSEGWKRYTGFANTDPSVKHRKYGVMAAFSRFTPAVADSLIEQQPETEAWIEVGPSRAAYGNAQSFSRAKLFYGNSKTPVMLHVFSGGTEIYSSPLIADGAYHVIDIRVDKPSVLKYVFKGKDSPDIYAFSLEGSGGIMADNIALRGASGTFFNKLDRSLLQQMYNDLEAGVFILQFGGNTVPYLDDEKEAINYGSWLEAQMRNLKKMRPGAVIIVIGPSDMSTKSGEGFVTYPLLPKVVDAMKNAAFNSGAAYWDMYAAMGGENSMSGWVDKKLAGDDYTHFTPGGARYIIQMFYEALMYEYNLFANEEE